MDFTNLKKLEPTGPRHQEVDADRLITAVVKVRKANYHPRLLAVRSQIDSCLFTAELKARDLRELEADPLVETVSLAKTLQSFK